MDTFENLMKNCGPLFEKRDMSVCTLSFAYLQRICIAVARMLAKARCQWLTPIILCTWEAEIGRIMVQGQPGQIVPRPHPQNSQSKMD
jgi:hypothetical protein